MFKLDKTTVKCEFTLNEVNNLLTNCKFENVENRKMWESKILSNDYDNIQFRGGTLEEAIDLKDMTMFKSSLEKLKSEGLLKKLSPGQKYIPKRKRSLSEYDGDYDMNRQWDFKPFMATKKEKVPVPHVTLICDASIHQGYKSTQIDEYGALTWAIAQILENKGINTTIYMNAKASYVDNHNGTPMDFKIKIKDSKTYLSPKALAHAFRCVFIRRQTHNIYIMAAEFAKKEVAYSLGKPVMPENSVEYKNGELKLAIGALNDYKAVIKELEKIFK